MSDGSFGPPTRGFRTSEQNKGTPQPGRRRATESQKDSDQTETPKMKRVPPKGVIIPDRGWPKFLYSLNKLFNRADRVPKINAAQQADLERIAQEAEAAQIQADLDEYEHLLTYIIRRYNQARRWCTVIANVKGGASKSPSTAILAIFTGWVTRRLTTAIDNNPYEGTLWKWLDIDREETMTVRQMNERILDGRVSEFIDFSAPLGSNPYNVQLVVSDRVAQKQSYDHDIAKTVIVKTKNNSIFTVNDTSNDIGAGAVEAALEESDVLVVPALNKDDKLEGVRATMDNLSQWGNAGIIKHAVVLINGLHPGESAEDYREFLMLDQDTILIGIPFDAELDVFQPIIPEKLAQQTRIACLEYVLIVSRVARHTQENGFDSLPLQFKQGELATLANGRKPVLSYVQPSAPSTQNDNHSTPPQEGGAS